MLQNPAWDGIRTGSHIQPRWDALRPILAVLSLPGSVFLQWFSLASQRCSSNSEPSRVSRNSHVKSLRTGLKCHLCPKLCGKAAAHQGHGWGMSKRLQTSASLLREIISVFLHSDHTSYSDAQEQRTFLSSWFMWPLRFIPSDRSLKFFLFIFFLGFTENSYFCSMLWTAKGYVFGRGVSNKSEFNKLTKDCYPRDTLSPLFLVSCYTDAFILRYFPRKSPICHLTISLPQ